MKEYIVVLKIKTDMNIVHVAQIVNNAAEHIRIKEKASEFEIEIENIGVVNKNVD